MEERLRQLLFTMQSFSPIQLLQLQPGNLVESAFPLTVCVSLCASSPSAASVGLYLSSNCQCLSLPHSIQTITSACLTPLTGGIATEDGKNKKTLSGLLLSSSIGGVVKVVDKRLSTAKSQNNLLRTRAKVLAND